jgi:hypothetical protein
MTAQSNSNTAAKPASTKRFELPVLDFKFGSLTEGTDIPPPLPSPVQEVPTPPKTPTKEKVFEKVQETVPEKKESNGKINGSETAPKPEAIDTLNGGVKRPLEDGPASPAASSRGSLRRLLSKSLLNSTYNEQASIPGQSPSRPPSRTASSIADDRKAKRSSGWFRRLRSDNSSKRLSQQIEEIKKPVGPPPPMIPELDALETKIDTNLGDDLFKGIK